MSKLQSEIRRILIDYLGRHEIYENIRPEWLRAPNGSRLELDFYIPDLRMAIEVQGNQHYTFTPIFHDTYDDFKKRVEYDDIKREVCREKDIYLFEVTSREEVLEIVLRAGEIPLSSIPVCKNRQIPQRKDIKREYLKHLQESEIPKEIYKYLSIIFNIFIKYADIGLFPERSHGTIVGAVRAISRYEDSRKERGVPFEWHDGLEGEINILSAAKVLASMNYDSACRSIDKSMQMGVRDEILIH